MLEGKITGIDSGEINLYYRIDQFSWKSDTVKIENGMFSFSGKITQPTQCGLKTVGMDNFASIFIEPGKQEIFLKKGDFYHYKMHGSFSQRQSDTLKNLLSVLEKKSSEIGDVYDSLNNKFMKENDSIKKQNIYDSLQILNEKLHHLANDQILIEKEFILNHPESYVSIAKITQLFISDRAIDVYESKELYNKLDNKIKKSIDGKLILAQNKKWEMVMPGEQIPEIKTFDINGNIFQFPGLKDKNVLIDFWASWCIPCRKEIPHIKELYQKYKDAGIEIVFISLDYSKSDWQKAVKEEKLDQFVNLLSNKTMKDSIINTIMPIPNQILTGKNNMITWNSIFGENNVDLDTALKNSFK